jgi:NADPH:quinone reductase-like Zn-dependent oxidoreductase
MVGDLSGRGMLGILARLITALGLSWFTSRTMLTFLARPKKEDLTVMSELMKAGRVKPVIDTRYRLSEVAEAIRHLPRKARARESSHNSGQ